MILNTLMSFYKNEIDSVFWYRFDGTGFNVGVSETSDKSQINLTILFLNDERGPWKLSFYVFAKTWFSIKYNLSQKIIIKISFEALSLRLNVLFKWAYFGGLKNEDLICQRKHKNRFYRRRTGDLLNFKGTF